MGLKEDLPKCCQAGAALHRAHGPGASSLLMQIISKQSIIGKEEFYSSQTEDSGLGDTDSGNT